jgi:hypothetical protein
LTNQGDIVTTDGTTKSALAIGTSQYTLSSTGSAVTWNKMYTTNNVFYVATNGLDDVTTNGKTWDQPFKTISYAASIVQNGLAYTAQSSLLSTNKEFLVQEMYYGTLTNGSLQFSGNNSVAITANTNNLSLGTGNYTAECWVRYGTIPASGNCIFGKWNDTSGLEYMLNGGGSNNLVWVTRNTAAGFSANITFSAPSINAWHHIAAVNNGGTVTIYVDGVSTATASVSGTQNTNSGAPFEVGNRNNNSTYGYTGLISNLRIVAGTAVYTGAFTPSTNPLTAITNTQLLLNTLQGTSYLLDASTNNYTLTNNASVSSSTSSPVSGTIVNQTKTKTARC